MNSPGTRAALPAGIDCFIPGTRAVLSAGIDCFVPGTRVVLSADIDFYPGNAGGSVRRH
jgi:hypothetical protein